jgi:hypothetical protein
MCTHEPKYTVVHVNNEPLANRYVPRSSEAFATSWFIGLSTALYSLGLPVSSVSLPPTPSNVILLTGLKISGVPRTHQLDLGSFGISPLQLICDLGETAVPLGTTLEGLKRWTRESSTEAYMKDFAQIALRATRDWKKRRHLWHLPAIVIAAAQTVLFVYAITPLFAKEGIPKFMFSCLDNRYADKYPNCMTRSTLLTLHYLA